MPDTPLDLLDPLSPIPDSAESYFVSAGVDYRGAVDDLFVGRTLSATVGLGIRSSGAAFDLQIVSSEVLTANRALSIVLGNTARTLTIGASASVSGSNTGDQTPTSLGLVIGTNVQAWDADLDAIKDLAGTSGLLKKTAANTWALDTTYATQAYADSLVVGLLDDRGNYNASGNTYPATGGSGAAGAILKGDLWTISVAGVLGGVAVTAGDLVRALVDTPGQTNTNWAISETNIGFTPLNASLADGKIYIGNGSGIGTAVTPSGDVTVDNLGVTAIGALKVTNAMLAGSIDLTAKVTGILPSANGGTGNGFTKFSGPASAERTFTLPNASAVVLTDNASVTVAQGGTGVGTFAANGVLYGNGTGAILVTAQGAANSILIANAGAPAFSAAPTIGTSVTSPLHIGGTGTGSSLELRSTSGVGATDFIKFNVGDNGALEAMRITNAGHVGIGTTTPIVDATALGRYLAVDGGVGIGNSGTITVGSNQSNTAAYIGAFSFFNSNLGVAEKRTVTLGVANDGATNSGRLEIYTANAGTLGLRLQIKGDGRIGIGTAPATSAILDVASTTGAFMPPRMTTTQRDALTAGDSMLLYNTTLATMQYRKAGAWVSI